MYNLAEQTWGKLHSGDSFEVFREQSHFHYITSWSLFPATQPENLFWTGMIETVFYTYTAIITTR